MERWQLNTKEIARYNVVENAAIGAITDKWGRSL